MKKAAGFWAVAIALVLGIVGLICYTVNCNTDYFHCDLDTTMVACSVGALVLAAAILVFGTKKEGIVTDICFVGAAVLLIVALGMFGVARINKIAAVMTYENNAKNMADFTSCAIGLGCYAVAALSAIVGSFLKTSKQ